MDVPALACALGCGSWQSWLPGCSGYWRSTSSFSRTLDEVSQVQVTSMTRRTPLAGRHAHADAGAGANAERKAEVRNSEFGVKTEIAKSPN